MISKALTVTINSDGTGSVEYVSKKLADKRRESQSLLFTAMSEFAAQHGLENLGAELFNNFQDMVTARNSEPARKLTKREVDAVLSGGKRKG